MLFVLSSTWMLNSVYLAFFVDSSRTREFLEIASLPARKAPMIWLRPLLPERAQKSYCGRGTAVGVDLAENQKLSVWGFSCFQRNRKGGASRTTGINRLKQNHFGPRALPVT